MLRLALILVALASVAVFVAGILNEPRESEAGHDNDHAMYITHDGETYTNVVTRNLILGKPIDVCSDDFPMSAQEGINRWEAALGIDVFTSVDEDLTECEEILADKSKGIASAIITIDTQAVLNICDKENRGDDYEPFMCVTGLRVYGVINEKWFTLTGRAEILVNSVKSGYSGDDVTGGLKVALLRDITHELGHVLGLGDYFCDGRGRPEDNYAPGSISSLMHTSTKVTSCNSPNGRPTQRDIDDYCDIYRPEAVAGLPAQPGSRDGEVTILWDPSGVHVEKEFEV